MSEFDWNTFISEMSKRPERPERRRQNSADRTTLTERGQFVVDLVTRGTSHVQVGEKLYRITCTEIEISK